MKEKILKRGSLKRLISVVLTLAMVVTLLLVTSMTVYADGATTPTGSSMDEAGCETHPGTNHLYITGAHSNSNYVCGIQYKADGTIDKRTNKLGDGFGRSYFPTGRLWGWYYWDSGTSKFVACDGHHGKHEAGTEWKTSETKHWHACNVEGCKTIYNEADHSYGESGAARYTCTVCGYVDRAFANFKTEIGAITGEGTVTLEKNIFAVTGDTTIKIKAGQNVTIDLNGKTINANGILCPIFEVERDATLTIKGNGTITGVDGIYAGTVVALQGTLNLYDATITGNKTTSNGGAVYMYDGTAAFTMYSGTLSNNSANYGGAIRVGKGNTFTMNGGTISGNTANKSGAIFINEGNASLLGGEITGNTSTSRGAVAVDTAITVGGNIRITGNTTNEVESNLYVRIIDKPDSKIKVSTQKPLNGANIGISVDAESDDQLPKEIGITENTNCLKTDNNSYELQVIEGKMIIRIHQHSWAYTADGATLTAKSTCHLRDSCEFNKIEQTVSLVLTATSQNYSGSNEYAATLSDTSTWTAAGLAVPDIKYYKANAKGSVEGTEEVTNLVGLAVGNYYAAITAGEGDGAKTAKVAFEIKSDTTAVTGVSLNKPTTTLTAGGATETLIATVAPDNATNKNVTWSSSDTAVASVSETGVVTPLKAGTTTITVTTVDGNKTATCEVNVNADSTQENPGDLTPEQPKCVIQFNTHGAGEIPNEEVSAYTTIELPQIRKAGYILKGWRKESEGNSILYIERTIQVTTSDTLHADWKEKSSDSSSSTSSSSSSTSSSNSKTEVPKAQPVIVDGKKYDIGNQKVSGGETNFTVDQTQFTSYIEKAATGSEAVIPITTNTDKVKAQLNLQNVKDMSDKSISLKVENQKVTYTIPANAIDTSAVANELDANNLKDIPVEIVLEKADSQTIKQVKDAMEAQKGEVIGTPMKFEIKASANGKEVKIDSFNTYVKNSLEVSQKEAEAITTAVIIMSDGSMRHVPTAVYMKDNKYLADVNSKTNGTYVLVKNNVAYSDAEGKWYEGVANELGSRMITSCLDKENTNTIQGEKAITREEFAALLVNALGLPQTSNAAATFSDVTGSSYIAEIGAAYEYGIINGVTETTFAPNKTITRQEAMAMLQRAAKIAELAGQEGDTTSFKDASKISNWAQEAVAFNVGNGLIVGSNGEVRPQATITRAESMTATLRLLQKSNLIDVRTEA